MPGCFGNCGLGPSECQACAEAERAKWPKPNRWEYYYNAAVAACRRAKEEIDKVAGYSGSSGNWPLQESSGKIDAAIKLLE